MAPAEASEASQETVNSIIDYMNSPQRQWKGGEKYRFADPHDCYTYRHSRPYLVCKVNTEEESFLGKRVCRSRTLTYTYPSAEETDEYAVGGGECSDWEKVANTPPEPQPAPTPAAQPSPEQSPATDKLTYTPEQIAIGAGSAFLIGGVFGAVLGLAAGKKKGTWNDV